MVWLVLLTVIHCIAIYAIDSDTFPSNSTLTHYSNLLHTSYNAVKSSLDRVKVCSLTLTDFEQPDPGVYELARCALNMVISFSH